MRTMDVLLVFPALLLAIAIVSALGPGLINAQLAIGIVAIPIYARIMRASVLGVREADFVTASRALGEGVARARLPADPAEQPDADHRRRHPRASPAPSSTSRPCRSSGSAPSRRPRNGAR